MAYRVEIARRAESDLEELYLWVVERAPQQGARWFNGLERGFRRWTSIRSGVPSRPRASIPITRSEF
jgi:plasmid stabilization system protein ParE